MSADNTQPTRRQFLQAVVATPIALRAQQQEPQPKKDDTAKKQEPKKETPFTGIAFTDQHGKAFDPAELEQALVVFGFEGCPECQKISTTVAAVQSKLLTDKKNVPIIIVSVQPDADRDSMKSYVAYYYKKGAKQFAREELPEANNEKWKNNKNEKLTPEEAEAARESLGEKSFETAKNLPQRDRILHVICPPDSEAAKLLQTRLGHLQNPKNPESHTSYITLIKNGVKAEEFRALPYNNSAPDEKFLKRLADQVSASIPAPAEDKSPKR